MVYDWIDSRAVKQRRISSSVFTVVWSGDGAMLAVVSLFASLTPASKESFV